MGGGFINDFGGGGFRPALSIGGILGPFAGVKLFVGLQPLQDLVDGVVMRNPQ
ncbi:hypothetical protein N4219_09715 [Yersinia enterocolitica]|uniref:hypothetical protein n=1 Tax=Yersinia TaxID=629 RepID=UPI000A925693|nr:MULTISPECIES: hypothetical protein [Yersinia]ELY5205582.1 hypothetical protein [Yersinia enterocolitica]UYJ82728.1 hypothetical protein N4219_09715 [Yersinia enterocolitica]HDL8331457.1 hypothetical protein [Yersinia enterocolitica]HDM8455685.1 hypothetical protein [Yersinia enterocolitica]HEI6804853.1 hypothetical protein [Yersinia enterocolitica]